MWAIRIGRTAGDCPETIEPRLNGIGLRVSVGLALLTGPLCGVAPALRASAVAPEPILRGAGRGSACVFRPPARGPGGRAACRRPDAGHLRALLLQSLADRQRLDLVFVPKGAFRGELHRPVENYQRCQPCSRSSKRSEKSFKQVASGAGFDSVDVMRRAFVRLLGITPSRYRELADNRSGVVMKLLNALSATRLGRPSLRTSLAAMQ